MSRSDRYLLAALVLLTAACGGGGSCSDFLPTGNNRGNGNGGGGGGGGTTTPPPVASCVESAEPASPITRTVQFEASDGATLHVIVRGVPDKDGELCARPAIVEFSPYGGNG